MPSHAEETSTQPTTAATMEEKPSEDGTETKSHTFRKRRLTYTKLNLDPQAVAALEGLDDDDEADDEPNYNKAALDKNHAGDEEKNENEEEGEKGDGSDYFSKTFRKRRLTLTKHQVASALAAVVAEIEDDFSDDEDESADEPRKKRRLSDMSQTSEGSKKRRLSDASGRLKSRVVHAGEISRNPGSVGGASNSQLYQGPFNQEEEPTEEERSSQPQWRRRMTRRNSENELNLPFPRSVVGTYSCHGVEPVYESDYEPNLNDDDDDSDEEQWLKDINSAVEAHNDAQNGGGHSANKGNEGGEKDRGTKAEQDTETKPLEKVATKNPSTIAKINQDRGGVAFPYGNCPKTALFAVYDGHGQGGELVSQYALYHIQKRLEKHPSFNDNIENAFKETFVAVDQDLRDEPLIEPLYAGTTACVALLREGRLTVSSAGDSRAVLARSKEGGLWQAIDLSKDHNPDVAEEQSRIEEKGGFVSPPPEEGLSARVWLDADFTQIGLAMSRSIGDHAVKHVGVIAEPVVSHHDVQDNDEFMVLASDGVWEFISSDEAVEIVGNMIAQGASKACQALIEAAANRWHKEEGDYRDDITALVVRLRNVWDATTSLK